MSGLSIFFINLFISGIFNLILLNYSILIRNFHLELVLFSNYINVVLIVNLYLNKILLCKNKLNQS